MEYVPRLLDSFLNKYLTGGPDSPPVLLIRGAPQVGKTRLIEHGLEKVSGHHVSFSMIQHPHFLEQVEGCTEFSQFRKLLEKSYGLSLGSGTVLFIDDIQESQRLASFVPRMRDAWHGCRVILCGTLLPKAYASVLDLADYVVTNCVVQPYQFSEFLLANQKGSLARHVGTGKTAIFDERHSRLLEWLERFLEVGGLPEVVDWASHGEDYEFNLDAIINGIDEQLKHQVGRDQLELHRDVLRRVAETHGRLELEDTMGALRLSGLAVGLPDMERLYFCDTGLSHRYMESEAPSFWDAESGDADAIASLGRDMVNQTALALSFQSATVVSAEHDTVDFSLEEGNAVIPICCRAVFHVTPELVNEGMAMLTEAGADEGVLVTLAPFETITQEGKTLTVIPLYLAEAMVRILQQPGSSV